MQPFPSFSTAPDPITVSLRPHPRQADLLQAGPDRVVVTMWREPNGDAAFAFSIERGDPAQLLLPAPGPAQAADQLWQHSCCEAFLALPGHSAYHEYNFSPSSAWAIYAFSREREQRPYSPAAAPDTKFKTTASGFTLHARLPVSLLPAGQATETLQVGLACVLERRDQTLEYWAIEHRAEYPDFHRRDSFSLLLPPSQPSLS